MDYAKKTREPTGRGRRKPTGKGKPARRGGGNRAATRNQPAVAQLPGWLWFGSGLISGIAACLMLYAVLLAPTQPGRDRPVADTKPAATPAITPATTSATATASDPSRFDFYEILTRFEIPATPWQPPVDEETSDAIYALQTGSFRREHDADNLRARLTLLGLTVYTRQVTRDGQLWHRVLVGPLNGELELNRARDKLADAAIESITLRFDRSG